MKMRGLPPKPPVKRRQSLQVKRGALAGEGRGESGASGVTGGGKKHGKTAKRQKLDAEYRGKCCWAGCDGKFCARGEQLRHVRVPYALTRSYYKDRWGVSVPAWRVQRLRKMWLQRCGFTGVHLAAALKNPELRVCEDHLPTATLFKQDARGRQALVFDEAIYPVVGPSPLVDIEYNAVLAHVHFVEAGLAPGATDAAKANARSHLDIVGSAALEGVFDKAKLENTIQELEHLKLVRKSEGEEKTAAAEKKAKTPKTPQRVDGAPVRLKSFRARGRTEPAMRKQINALTGLGSIEVVDALYKLVDKTTDGNANNLYLWRAGSSKPAPSRTTAGYQKNLKGEDQLFLTLMLLKTGCRINAVASLFDISPSSCTSYFIAWLHALSVTLSVAFPYPNRALLDKRYPPLADTLDPPPLMSCAFSQYARSLGTGGLRPCPAHR